MGQGAWYDGLGSPGLSLSKKGWKTPPRQAKGGWREGAGDEHPLPSRSLIASSVQGKILW